jgi:hypothetical protein
MPNYMDLQLAGPYGTGDRLFLGGPIKPGLPGQAYQLGLNNVNLLLNSGTGQPYDPATGQATVGRNYTYQTMASVSVFYLESVRINPFMGAGALGTAIDDYNGDNFDHAGLGFVGGGYIAAWTTTPRIRSVPSLIGLLRRSASSTSSILGHWCSNGRARRCTPCRQGARCGLGSGTGRTHRDTQPRASTGATADTAGWGSPWDGSGRGVGVPAHPGHSHPQDVQRRGSAPEVM